jgi:hypothetical protein
VYFQRNAPVLAFEAYTLSSKESMYTTPLATVGEDRTTFPVGYGHPGRGSPVLAFKAYTLKSSDPTLGTLLVIRVNSAGA